MSRRGAVTPERKTLEVVSGGKSSALRAGVTIIYRRARNYSLTTRKTSSMVVMPSAALKIPSSIIVSIP